MVKAYWQLWIALATFAPAAVAQVSGPGEEQVLGLLRQESPYTSIPKDLFDQLGWDLPDGGAHVKSLADAAPGGAFDPRKLEALPADKLGYRAKWHEVRYPFYGLDWDIPGLHLAPNRPLPGAPTLVIIHGGSANWYEFFVDPLNRPGLGQYLAQKVPVLLVTIPGNYKHGGWTDPYGARVPAYLLHKTLSPGEAKVRNAIYTFRLVSEGVRRLIEAATTGPVVVVGHSTGGEIRFILEESSLKNRMGGLSLGWGTGGPASLTKLFDEKEGDRARSVERLREYPLVWILRPRSPEGYVGSKYIGPLNPTGGASDLEVARRWFQLEERRRPQFKQVLQDLEHQGTDELRQKAEKEVRQALEGNGLGIKPDPVIADLFSTNRSPLSGYRKMIWVVARLDNGHWNANPEKARELQFANEFRRRNPAIPIRVALFDVPMTHYGHIEKPRQVAAGLVAALRWLVEP
ncbi:MAG: alpha/beta fold hydrolase [Acidobacteria bacterium]|nr:alpha/beta fold hydrolase [Acidobacteriota bacterium]